MNLPKLYIRNYFKTPIKTWQYLTIVSSLILLIVYCNGGNSIIGTGFSQTGPSIKDPSLKVELVTDGLQSPTSMAFIDNNDILINQKAGQILKLNLADPSSHNSILNLVGVNSKNERGLLGLAIDKNLSSGNLPANSKMSNSGIAVFIYVTESGSQANTGGADNAGNGELRNRVYKYTWDGNSLTNPVMILDLPAGPGTNHQGGKLKIGPDGQLYAVIGELKRNGQLQNIKDGPGPDNSGVIFRVNPSDGSPANNNPLATASQEGSSNLLAKYYAYGIRNSFGLDFDPVTKVLWDTENGEDLYDEVNMVNPGFNSGWKLVMGPIANSGVTVDQLVSFKGSHYADPVVSFEQSRGITDIEFFKSGNFGPKYENNIFAGDITSGNLFFFEVNDKRDGLNLSSNPSIANDLVVTGENEISSVTLGTGFKGITDIETGPDGNLYVLTYDRSDGGLGALYKISKT